MKLKSIQIAFLMVASSTIAAEDFYFFEQEVRPLLVEHCYSCHSVSEKIKGGLALDSKQGWAKGGDSGPAVLPGDPEGSLVIQAVGYKEKDLEMPPKGKLPEAKIAILEKRIKQGAPDPRTTGTQHEEASTAIAASDLWSFQPLLKVTPPKVSDPKGADNPIDAFIRHRLDQENLSPAPTAEPATLLRRLHLTLTGLPPTPEDLEKYNSPSDAVGELLASAAFGDRWGRHWLDLSAYADTIGVGRTIPAIDAWRYRDYVIAAFNSDKPFDQFIKQQLSGDIKVPSAPGVNESPDQTAEDIIATGFLALGPWELVGGDKVQLRMDVIDRQINRMGKAFLGMTMECARCHDHKFDPISQADYFALAGIFKSTVTLNGRINGVFSDINKTQLPESPDELIARAERIRKHNLEIADQTQLKDSAKLQADDLKNQIEQLKKGLEETVTATDKTKEEKELAELEKQHSAASQREKKHSSRIAELRFIRHSIRNTQAYAVKDTPEPMDSPINIRGSAHQLGAIIPRGFPAEIAPKDKPAFTRGGSGRVQLAEWIAHEKNPLTARVWVNRVWYHLFGEGLVRTVDNFGAMGEKPSHPELLDYLATEFMKDGWSTKNLIRRIVLSKTWQQASTNPKAIQHGIMEKDPANRLLWRANRHRLEAEAIRDSMLFISGKLDRQRSGPSLPFHIPGNLSPGGTGNFKDSSPIPNHIKYRRTVYLPQKRKGPFTEMDFISAFDLPDNNHETGHRPITAVPTQALYLANSKFVQDAGMALSKRFPNLPPKERISTIYLHALCRQPTCQELDQAQQFIDQMTEDLSITLKDKAKAFEQAWARFCQALLITNEFLFRS